MKRNDEKIKTENCSCYLQYTAVLIILHMVQIISNKAWTVLLARGSHCLCANSSDEVKVMINDQQLIIGNK